MNSSPPPAIHLEALLRTLAAPLIVWGALVFGATATGQPGVICVTPMAWLLALWSGGQYIQISGGSLGRWPLLGPALVGALLGIGMSVLFIFVSTTAMPTGPDPEEMRKAQNLNVIISVSGVIACTVLSMITAGLTLQRYRRGE